MPFYLPLFLALRFSTLTNRSPGWHSSAAQTRSKVSKVTRMVPPLPICQMVAQRRPVCFQSQYGVCPRSSNNSFNRSLIMPRYILQTDVSVKRIFPRIGCPGALKGDTHPPNSNCRTAEGVSPAFSRPTTDFQKTLKRNKRPLLSGYTWS